MVVGHGDHVEASKSRQAAGAALCQVQYAQEVTNTNQRRFRVSKRDLDGRISAAAKLIVWCYEGFRARNRCC